MQGFSISQRHHGLIAKQVETNFPQECGGFLGGIGYTIQAVLPTFNQHLYDKTDTYALVGEDFIRARTFFSKHQLEYFGVYHSHPNGVAYPSQADIDTGHKYHFIISIQDSRKIEFRVFEIQNREVLSIPLEVIPDNKFQVVDIFKKKESSLLPPHQPMRDVQSEVKLLESYMDNIRHSSPLYPKFNPIRLDSDFSTLA